MEVFSLGLGFSFYVTKILDIKPFNLNLHFCISSGDWEEMEKEKEYKMFRLGGRMAGQYVQW